MKVKTKFNFTATVRRCFDGGSIADYLNLPLDEHVPRNFALDFETQAEAEEFAELVREEASDENTTITITPIVHPTEHTVKEHKRTLKTVNRQGKKVSKTVTVRSHKRGS